MAAQARQAALTATRDSRIECASIVASRHPDLDAEQAYVDFAHDCLEAARKRAARAAASFRVRRGGTEQARFEREAMLGNTLARLTRLDIGDRSLVFGRIDLSGARERFYIGRAGLWDADSNPVVVDWRAPVAEPFYRATGSQPLGLERRRNFASRGRTLLGIEDEFFGGAAGKGLEVEVEDGRRRGAGVLAAAMDAPRTGRLQDIAATIQAEQDEVIRARLPGVLVVDGGPGTGKTVVALHRAAYLLYTHRFPLEDQGVLVVGPHRLFLAYVEQVLPSLGEAGVELAVPADLLHPAVRVSRFDGDSEEAGRLKGDPRMARLLRRAVRDRQRPLRRDLVVGYGLQKLRLSAERSARITADARRRTRKHNAGRLLVEQAFYTALADGAAYGADPVHIRELVGGRLEVREALEWMWPVLTPAHLLNDLFGSKALIRSAAGGRLDPREIDLLHRRRGDHADNASWSLHDVALLDEARALLGFRPRHREEDAVPNYGHIVVDEAQDLSPMELRMIARRSLNGSMTVVGDMAQATGVWQHESWDSVLAGLAGLPDRGPPRRAQLTIGYRISAPTMALAARVLPLASPGARPPTAVRADGDEPRVVDCGRRPDACGGDSGLAATDLAATLAAVVDAERAAAGEGNVAVIVPASLHDWLRAELSDRGVDVGGPGRRGLDRQVTLAPVRLVKGLEVDSAVVVEPARIVAEESCGMRSLYVALTRATKRVAVVHAERLPDVIRLPDAIAGDSCF